MATKKEAVKQPELIPAKEPVAPASETQIQQPTPQPTQPQRLTPIQQFKKHLDDYAKSTLPSLLEAHGLTVPQFTHIVLSEVKKNDKLLQAFRENPASMFASILQGAEIGLIPSDMIGEFYLIPRNLKQKDGSYKMTVTPQIGYKGLVNILMRSGDITRIHTEVVYEGDEFTPIYGIEPTIIHKPNFNVPRKAENITFVYAVAKNRMGEYQFEVLSRQKMLEIITLSKYDNELYFNDKKDPNRWMERKLALVQLGKMLPKDYYSKKALALDGAMEGGAIITLDENNQVKVVEGTPIKTSRLKSIYNTLNSPELPRSSEIINYEEL